jgi:hypothetical protein
MALKILRQTKFCIRTAGRLFMHSSDMHYAVVELTLQQNAHENACHVVEFNERC